MLSLILCAVLGGALLGVVIGLLLGREWPKRLFALVGAIGGGFGLLIYEVIIATMRIGPKFFWDGISWAILGITFSLAVLIISLGGQKDSESGRGPR